MGTGVTPLYDGWQRINAHLVAGLPKLGQRELELKAGPDGWPIWALVAHLAGARVYWLCGVFGEPGAETTPFPDPQGGAGWGDRLDVPRDGDELLIAVESSWRIIEACLNRWTPDTLARTANRERGTEIQVHSRQSVLTRLVMHDSFHRGELSMVQGMHRVPCRAPWEPLV